MKNIHLELNDDLHIKARQMQLNYELKGNKINLKDLFVLIIEAGLTKLEQDEKKEN